MEVKPYAKNSKKHPDSQLKLIAYSLKEFGWRQPIVVDKDGTIIVGHGRWMAYQKYPDSIAEPRIEVAENLTPAQVKAYRLADNKTNESDWDMDLAIEELKELDSVGVDITLLGFDNDLLLEGSEKDDVIPEEAPTRANLGDLWQLGEHRVLCGDATKMEDVGRLMGDKKVDLLLTDPPYNVAYVGKTKDALTIENDAMSDSSFRKFLKDAFTAAFAYVKPGGVYYIWHADSEGYNFRGALHDIGVQVRQCLIWNKNSMVMGRQDYHWKHEPCLYGWKDGASHLWASDRTQTTVLDFARPTSSQEHPTMKPVELIAYQITNNTKGEDIVLDTFGGSGSTLIAAEKTGRICYMMELDPKYIDVIIKRYEDFTGKTATKL